MRRITCALVLVVAAASWYGCGGCQDEAKAPPAPMPTAIAVPGASDAAPKAPAAAAPEGAQPNGEEGEGELIIWAGSEPDSGPPPLTVTFSVESLEEGFADPSYEWDFGDGSPVSKEASPTHTYEKLGQYTARVTVTQADGRKGHDETWVEVEAPEDKPAAAKPNGSSPA